MRPWRLFRYKVPNQVKLFVYYLVVRRVSRRQVVVRTIVSIIALPFVTQSWQVQKETLKANFRLLELKIGTRESINLNNFLFIAY